MLSSTHRRLRRATAAVLAAGATALAFAATVNAAGPAADPTAAEFERAFLAQTIDHHFMGVEMGRLCMDKSRSRRLGDICTAIVVNQSAENVRMRDDFLLGWYGVEKHPAMAAADRRMLRELEAKRGRSFDIALSRMFIEHHQMQIARSRQCVTAAAHHELKHLCMDQIETQTREIRQFRRVLLAYGRSR